MGLHPSAPPLTPCMNSYQASAGAVRFTRRQVSGGGWNICSGFVLLGALVDQSFTTILERCFRFLLKGGGRGVQCHTCRYGVVSFFSFLCDDVQRV